MPLVTCADCGMEMSSEAVACPKCGKPNKKVVAKTKDSKQAMGCLFMLLSLVLGFFFGPLVGAVVFIVGLVIVLLNTRLH
jgi:hypothetical protein